MTGRFPTLKTILTTLLVLAVLAACQTTPPPVTTDDVTLTVTVAGGGTGTITSSPAGIDIATGETTGSADFAEGTEVTLPAVADEGSIFTSWSGACTGADTCVVPMDDDTAVTATFELVADVDLFTLDVEVTGGGTGTVTSTPSGIDIASGETTGSADFPDGTEVTLTAVADEGSIFTGWSGACTGIDPCAVTMDDDTAVTATFELVAGVDMFTLDVEVTGDGTGTVTSTPSGIDIGEGETTDSASFAEGTEVTLTAVAAAGSTFTGWSGACSGTETCSLSMNADESVTADFALIDTSDYTLTVDVVGNGEGSVSSEPAGVDVAVGETTGSAEFQAGTEVTLTATVEGGSGFAGWTGGGCSGTALTCTVTVTADTTVTAEFFDLTADVTTSGFSILTGTDDAEEFRSTVNEFYVAGGVQTGSTDLDLAYDVDFPSQMYVGLRYGNVTVPQGAIITSATITFTRRGGGAGVVTLVFEGQALDDAPTFEDTGAEGTASFGISGRPRTSAATSWQTGAWGLTATTPDLASLVQEIVDRDGWESGNALAFTISSDDSDEDNHRRAHSFETPNGTAPQLSITYYVPTAP